ncbi:hypothetical protein JKP88DRAFT_261068 [Tribonema minus]|uniref:DUF5710 domain-containing protein n=1 Tax=Tribonema minus TaxID=303371 RepID=A0A836CEV4_9STRA|nr:hypothetical protein JKP88DRAFT_261068 [Tribonema minus]
MTARRSSRIPIPRGYELHQQQQQQLQPQHATQPARSHTKLPHCPGAVGRKTARPFCPEAEDKFGELDSFTSVSKARWPVIEGPVPGQHRAAARVAERLRQAAAAAAADAAAKEALVTARQDQAQERERQIMEARELAAARLTLERRARRDAESAETSRLTAEAQAVHLDMVAKLHCVRTRCPQAEQLQRETAMRVARHLARERRRARAERERAHARDEARRAQLEKIKCAAALTLAQAQQQQPRTPLGELAQHLDAAAAWPARGALSVGTPASSAQRSAAAAAFARLAPFSARSGGGSVNGGGRGGSGAAGAAAAVTPCSTAASSAAAPPPPLPPLPFDLEALEDEEERMRRVRRATAARLRRKAAEAVRTVAAEAEEIRARVREYEAARALHPPPRPRAPGGSVAARRARSEGGQGSARAAAAAAMAAAAALQQLGMSKARTAPSPGLPPAPPQRRGGGAPCAAAVSHGRPTAVATAAAPAAASKALSTAPPSMFSLEGPDALDDCERDSLEGDGDATPLCGPAWRAARRRQRHSYSPASNGGSGAGGQDSGIRVQSGVHSVCQQPHREPPGPEVEDGEDELQHCVGSAQLEPRFAGEVAPGMAAGGSSFAAAPAPGRTVAAAGVMPPRMAKAAVVEGYGAAAQRMRHKSAVVATWRCMAPQQHRQDAEEDIVSVMAATKRRVYLNVPLKEVEACRAAGGRWDPNAGRWFIGAGMNIAKFSRGWLPTLRGRCTGHDLPALPVNLGGQRRVLVCAQRFCCDYIQDDEDVEAADPQEDGAAQSAPQHLKFEKVIPGFKAPLGTAGLTGYCWSYLQEGVCANVAMGTCCCLKHATAKTQQ